MSDVEPEVFIAGNLFSRSAGDGSRGSLGAGDGIGLESRDRTSGGGEKVTALQASAYTPLAEPPV